ncbi:MAG: DUF2793 domain-containing protein [Sphingomonadaceae bacterium]
MPLVTDRLKLPLLAAAQTQKEMTHNEALAVADIAVQAVVVAVAPTTVPTAPVIGQCWIVNDTPTGAWAGQSGAIACWTSAGWRFLAPFEGLMAWSLADGVMVRWTASGWAIGALTAATLSVGGERVIAARQPRVPAPSGGGTVDNEARAALGALIAGLEAHGLFSAV